MNRVACVWIALGLAALSLAGAAEPDAGEIAPHVANLDSEDPKIRGAAEKALDAAGRAAVKPLGDAALKGRGEQQFRAIRVLARLVRSDDEATAAAAADALRAVAAGGDPAGAERAKEELSYFDRLELMRKMAAAFELLDASQEPKRVPVPLIARPLHRFEDRLRDNLDGTLWGYGRTDKEGGIERPQAVIAIFPFTGRGGEEFVWYSDVVSLAAGPLRVSGVDGNPALRWSPANSGEELRAFPDTPPPAEKPDDRLAELHTLARRLEARQNSPAGEKPYDLALWPKLLHRYRDEKAGILDGGLFIFVHDTNPEVIVLIEARGKPGQAETKEAQWRYALHRHTAAPLYVELDGKEVWGSPAPGDFLSGGPNPYWVLQRRPPRRD